jgi:hypothetical protein
MGLIAMVVLSNIHTFNSFFSDKSSINGQMINSKLLVYQRLDHWFRENNIYEKFIDGPSIAV